MKMKRGIRAAAGALFIAVFSLGCDQRQRDRSEAGKVLRALEVVRAAPNENKRLPAEELSHVVCSTPVVCGARDQCADAYRHLAVGTEAALKVKSELDKLEQEPATDREKMTKLASELDRADSEINGARESMVRCEEAASTMRRTFGI
ncbi:MAG TPA: hypothetical protein VGL13_03540 [Polyangiaceae bacterium]|jgi:hypothetical protein